jgi:uncharacterized BrkB/YihY/UPF0761 family membrane protein
MKMVAFVVGLIISGLLGFLGLIVVYLILRGRIDLSKLISEPNGDASLSRFQFLLFTFVIAMSLFLIVISKDPPVFPEIPVEILALLGISGGSYVISKGIQTSRDIGLKPSSKDEERETVRPEKTVGKKDIGDR